MLILIDSREQKKLSFGCDWEVRGLNFGDYGCLFSADYQHPLVFERKNKADLFGSLSAGYDRFKKCFARAEKAGYKMVICIEGTKEKILSGYEFSARDPESIILQLETIKTKYGVDHIFFASRISMANHIHDYYREQYDRWYDSPEKS